MRTAMDLAEKQALPLDLKVMLTKQRQKHLQIILNGTSFKR